MKKLFIILMILFSSALWANSSPSDILASVGINKDWDTTYCADLDYRECNRSTDCRWDSRSYQCEERYSDDSTCEYIQSKRACDRNRTCQWSHYNRSCENKYDNGNNRCYHYENRYSCDSNRNCEWNDWDNSCERIGGESPRSCENIRSRNNCLDTTGCAWDSVNRFCQRNPFSGRDDNWD